MSTAAKFLSSRRSDRILAIHDECDTATAEASAGADITERFSKITVSAGHGQGAAREEHARSPDQSVLNSPRDARIAAADISHRGETAVEGMAQHLGGVARDVGQWLRFYVRDLETGAQNMAVRVNQARHQGFAGDIDDMSHSASKAPGAT
jgi:hypothetical protein